MAKGINIEKYRGLKIRREDKVVIHLTDENGKKLHVRFKWEDWTEMIKDATTPSVNLS